MPGSAKAAVLLVWAQTALVVMFLALGFAGAAPSEMEVPDDVGDLLLVGALTVVGGGIIFTLSFLLISGRNWARIALTIYYVAIGTKGLVTLILEGTSGSELRDLLLGVLMVVLLLSPRTARWCKRPAADR